MKTQHTSICASANFIPDRPSEAVSGGYDSTLLHFDFRQGTLLSKREFASVPQTSAVSVSPPFVLCLSVSSTGPWRQEGLIKKTRKWGGLREDMGLSKKIADGPVVAMAFLNTTMIVTSTLLGNISGHVMRIGTFPIAQTEVIAKVNALAIHGDNIALGDSGWMGKESQ
ncbi:hypothetical protein EI94DRAFT_1712292, partial [Lactarius quietus]